MNKNRLETFSDSVIAIIITIMVLELYIPKSGEIKALAPLFHKFLSYILSYIYLAIYWKKHHHLLYTLKNVSTLILWTNFLFLFWLSLIPFATGWMGENHFDEIPVAFYGLVLFGCNVSYFILKHQIIKKEGKDSLLSKAIGKDNKSKISLLLYFVAVIIAFFIPWISGIIYSIVAIIWVVPDKRIEKVLNNNDL